jgi:hypothetical protein
LRNRILPHIPSIDLLLRLLLLGLLILIRRTTTTRLNKRNEFVFVVRRDVQLSDLLKLRGAGVVADDDEGGVLGEGFGELAAVGFDELFGVFAGYAVKWLVGWVN